MHSISAVLTLPTDVLPHPTNNTPDQGGMPPTYIDAIRDVLLFPLQFHRAPMQLSMDGFSNQFAALHTNVHNEVKVNSQTINSLESFLEQTNARLICLDASNDTQSLNQDQLARDQIRELQAINNAMAKPPSPILAPMRIHRTLLIVLNATLL